MFLNCLEPDEIRVIEAIGRKRDYPKGSFLLREGESGSSFILILAGKVEVRKRLAEGKYKQIGTLNACDLIGEIGFLGVHNRTASVIALEDTEGLEFSRHDFLTLIERHPVIGVKAYRGMAEELALRLSRSGDDLIVAMTWALAKGSA